MSGEDQFSQDHAGAIEAMKDQLIIVLIKRLGGKVDIPVAEIDDTAQHALLMRLDPSEKRFEFEVRRKP